MTPSDEELAWQPESNPFRTILKRLIKAVPGCQAAVFVDYEGEAVEVAGVGEEFDIKVAGAEWRLILHHVAPLQLGLVQQIIIRALRRGYLIHQVLEGYALVLVLDARAAFHVSERALGECAFALCVEAGFENKLQRPLWNSVEVRPWGSRRARPERARGQGGRGQWHPVQVIGLMMGLPHKERGYRVRLANGAEATLIREPLGRWWSDELLE